MEKINNIPTTTIVHRSELKEKLMDLKDQGHKILYTEIITQWKVLIASRRVFEKKGETNE